MHVLVLGGTGFLGSALTPRLLERGHRVTVLTRNAAALPRIEAAGSSALLGDLLVPGSFSTRDLDVDVVVLIAQPEIFGRRAGALRLHQLARQVTRMHEAALSLARGHRCPIVLTSGTSFRTEGEQVADESWPLRRAGIARVGAGTDALLEKARAAGVPAFVRILPGQIYGPGGMLRRMYEWARQGRNLVIGTGSNHIPRIHVDDCADAYVRVVERLPVLSNGDSFIAADDVACTTMQFAEELARQAGLPPPRLAPPLMRVAVRLAMGASLYETVTMDCRVSNARLKRLLGWTPTYPSYREGLAASMRDLVHAEEAATT